MATGEALGKDDLFQRDAFNDAIKGAETLLTVIKSTKEEIKGSLAAQKEFVSTFKTKSFDDVKRLNVELKQTSDLIKMKQQLEVAELKVLQQQQTLEQASIKTMIEKNKLTQQQLKAEQDLTKAIEAETKANQKAEQQLRQTNGEYKKAVQSLGQVKQQLKELQFTGRDKGKLFKSLSDEFKTLDEKVRLAEQSVGEFQRNVGNYASGFNPLRNSINQLTREMPAFANSVQTGFMAISNNIPAFFDAIKGIKAANAELVASGKPTTSVLSQLGAAFFSWGTALSVGVTLLTVYGKELVNFIGEIITGKDAIVAVNEALAKTYENSTKLIEAEIKAIQKLLVARGQLTNEEVEISDIQNKLAKDKRERLRNFKNEQDALAKELLNFDEIKQYGIEIGSLFANDQKAFEEGAKRLRDIAMADIKRMEVTAAAEIETIRLNLSKDKLKSVEKANNDELKALEDFRKKREALFAKWAEIDRENDKEIAKTKSLELAGSIQELEDIYKQGYSRFEAAQKKAAKEFNISQDELMAEFYASGIEMFEDFLEQKRKLIERDKKLTKDVISSVDKIVLNIDRIYKERYKRAEDYLDREIDLNKSAIEQQQRLAERGLANTLAFEQAKAAKLQLQRQQLQEKEIKQQKRIAFYNLLSGYAKTDPSTALQRAILETTLAELVAGNFIEGTENVERDLQGNKVHNNQDGYVIAVDGKERILNPKQNKMIGDLSNDELAKIAADYNSGAIFNYGNIAQPMINVPKNNIDLSTTNAMLGKVLSAIENKPVNHTNLSNLGDVIETQITAGVKRILIHKRSRRI